MIRFCLFKNILSCFLSNYSYILILWNVQVTSYYGICFVLTHQPSLFSFLFWMLKKCSVMLQKKLTEDFPMFEYKVTKLELYYRLLYALYIYIYQLQKWLSKVTLQKSSPYQRLHLLLINLFIWSICRINP